MKVHVSVDLVKLHRKLLSEGTLFITIENLAKELSISTKSAGRILSKMHEKGLAVRCSRTTYKIACNDTESKMELNRAGFVV